MFSPLPGGRPRFKRLIRRRSLGRSEARHFRLCRSDEVAALRGEHPPEQRIFPLSYGDTHADLVPFLRALLPHDTAASPRLARLARLAAALTREEQAFQGRDDEARALQARMLGDPPAVAAILGPAGIGKSALALHVLHDPAVRARFAERRWFVRLDAATSAEAARPSGTSSPSARSAAASFSVQVASLGPPATSPSPSAPTTRPATTSPATSTRSPSSPPEPSRCLITSVRHGRIGFMQR